MISKECEECEHLAKYYKDGDNIDYFENVEASNGKYRLKLSVKALCEPVDETA